jgi:hypothetical protein
MTPNESEMFQKQIDSLGERVEKGLDEIKEMLRSFEARVRKVEGDQARCEPTLTMRLDAAWRRIDQHEAELVNLRKLMDEAVLTNRILKWILGIVTVVLAGIALKILSGVF